MERRSKAVIFVIGNPIILLKICSMAICHFSSLFFTWQFNISKKHYNIQFYSLVFVLGLDVCFLLIHMTDALARVSNKQVIGSRGCPTQPSLHDLHVLLLLPLFFPRQVHEDETRKKHLD